MAKIDPIIIKPASTIPELLTNNLFIWIDNHNELDQVMELAELYDIPIYPDSKALHKKRQDRDHYQGLLEFSNYLILLNCNANKADNIITHEYATNRNVIVNLNQLKTALHNLKPDVNNAELSLSEINYLKQLTLIKVKDVKDLFYLVELCNKYDQIITESKYRITPELPAMFDVKTECLGKGLGYLIHIEGLYIKISSNNTVHVVQENEDIINFKNKILAEHNFIIDDLELLEHLFKKEYEYLNQTLV